MSNSPRLRRFCLGRWFLFPLLGLFIFSCSDSPKFREYSERTSQTRFGALAMNQGGEVSTREVDLFNRILSPQSLASGITWQTPQGWTEIRESGVRLVSFRTRSDLEVTLIPFPGNVGGIKANLVRWLGQINVSLTDTEMEELVSSLEVGGDKGLQYILVDFDTFPPIVKKNQSDSIVAAIFGFSDQMLFVKISGNREVVKKDKQDFINLVKTIKIKST